MKFKGFFLHVPFLWVEAIAFFPFVLIRHAGPTVTLVNHERIHLRQQLEMGLILFYIWYLAEYLILFIKYKKHYLAYLHISFEQEAYRNEANHSYLKKRKLWSFIRYVSV